MALTEVEVNSEQQFSSAQEQLLREIGALRRLSELSTKAAEAMSALSLESFLLAKGGDKRADGLGNELLERAEEFFAEAKAFSAEAKALWQRLGQ